MAKYDKLDAAILRLLAAEPSTWYSIDHDLQAEFTAYYLEKKEPWRLTDSRIQALRKKGLIRPVRVRSSSVWELA